MLKILGIVSIIILGFVIYGNSLEGDFIWDDNNLIKNNVYIKNWSNIPKIFSTDWGSGAETKYNSYRPLCIFTYLVNYSIGKLDVRGYHLLNIILHILVSLSLYWFLSILFGNRLLSWLASILFLAHPVHTEVVAYMSGRTDSLAALFVLLSFIFYIKNLRVEKLVFYVLTLLSYVLALLSKENSIIFPVLLLAYHAGFRKKIKVSGYLSLVIISFAYIVLRTSALGDTALYIPSFNIIFERIPGFFVAIINYMRLLVLPFDLHMEYGSKLFSFTGTKALLGCFVSLLILIYALKRRTRGSLTFFSILWFFIALLPSSNIYPIGFYMAEHYLYLPSMGFFMFLAGGITYLYKTKKIRVFTLGVLAIGLLTFYSYLTIKQNNYWREPVAFYERTLKYAPRTQRLLCALANAYKAQGKHEKAISAYRETIELDPLTFYEKMLRRTPHSARLLNDLGNAFTCEGNPREAIRAYREAIELDPAYPDTYNNLGCLYIKIGKVEKARELFEKAIQLNPGYADAYSNLGSMYGSIGENKRAIELYKKALETNPNHALAHNGIGSAYYFEGEYDLAIEHCDKALELGYKVSPEILEFLESERKE